MDRHAAQLFQHLRRLAGAPASDAASDAELLDRFIGRRDEAAFATLVRRHGPMVLRVCYRALANWHAAEDAFQAAFLVLARRAETVRRPASLAAWLHGVAFRVAQKARAADRRQPRSLHPSGIDPPDPHSDPLAELSARELIDVLEGEVRRLPEDQRLAVVFCCFEGQSQEEAARRLGWSVASVRGRLERGRRRLHGRLVKRGLTLPTVLGAAAVWNPVSASAAVPETLACSTVRAALEFAAGSVKGRGIPARSAELAQEALKAMSTTKVGTAAVATLVLVAALGATAFSFQAQDPAAQPPTSRGGARQTVSPEALGKVPVAKEEIDRPVQVRFLGPAGAQLQLLRPTDAVAEGKALAPPPLTLPGRHDFAPGMVYRLKLSDLPGRPGLRLYPTVEVPAPSAETRTFLAHSAVPIPFTTDDLDTAAAGGLAVRALYLPRGGDKPGADPLTVDSVSSRDLEPGGDAIAEAARRGHLLAVVRLGGIDLGAKLGPAPTIPPPIGKMLWASLSINRPIFQEGDLGTLQIDFALVNDSEKVLDPRVGASKIVVNGKALDDSAFIFGNGPRDARFEALPASEYLLFGGGLGKHFEKPGVYRVRWEGEGFRSTEIVFRVVPKRGPVGKPGPKAPGENGAQ